MEAKTNRKFLGGNRNDVLLRKLKKNPIINYFRYVRWDITCMKWEWNGIKKHLEDKTILGNFQHANRNKKCNRMIGRQTWRK